MGNALRHLLNVPALNRSMVCKVKLSADATHKDLLSLLFLCYFPLNSRKSLPIATVVSANRKLIFIGWGSDLVIQSDFFVA